MADEDWPMERGGMLLGDGMFLTVRANRFGALRVGVSSETQTVGMRLTLDPSEAPPVVSWPC